MGKEDAGATSLGWCCSPGFWAVWLGVLLVAGGGFLMLEELASLRLTPGVPWLAAAGVACLATAARFRTPHCFLTGPALLAAALALQLDESGLGIAWGLLGPGLMIGFGAAFLLEEWLRTRRVT